MSLMQGRSDEEQLTIVERLRKCHHPSLAEGNKEKLETLFSLLIQVRSSPLHTDSLDMTSLLCVYFVLQHFCELCVERPPSLWLVDKLVPHLYQLNQMSPDTCALALRNIVLQKHAHYCEVTSSRAGRGVFPQLDTVCPN